MQPEMRPETNAAPSPEIIFEAVTAYQKAAALTGAIELDLFTAIAEGATTAPAIAARIQGTERATRILCDYLVVTDFLTKQDGEYGLTEASALFLDRRSPAYLGSITRFLHSDHLKRANTDFAAIVRRGGTLLGGEGSMDPEHPMWVDFARGMMPMMAPAAEAIATIIEADKGEPMRVLDIAAGHGVFGVAVARRNPRAEVTAVDWKSVLTVAQENAEAAGVADRFRQLPGSAFDVEYGGADGGYDVALVTNFFHHFDQPTCVKLMRKIHAALKPGGRAVTLEFVPNEDRITPPMSAKFPLMMLATTVAGDAYTFAEYDEMFRTAGFTRSELHQPPMTPEQVIVSYK
jgi:2-polyprenyl-3-methyl-5-hydroxy-6-metoxy-1,4-benzoquinol methylase